MARLLVIRQYYFPLDPRVRREVLALEMLGHEVDVICLARAGEPRREDRGNVHVYRIPITHKRSSLLRYVFEYAAFFALATIMAGALAARHRYRLVQVNTVPDTLAFAAIVPRLLGARVLLDLHECMPEFFASKFETAPDHPGVRCVSWLEQRSIGFADAAITCTHRQREAFVSRGAPESKVTVVVNGADESVFSVERHPPSAREDDRFVLICHGSVEPLYGLDVVIRAVALLRDEIPGLRLEIYGEGSQIEELEQLAVELSVEEEVWFSEGFVPIEELVEAIARADAGVVAMRRDPFRDLVVCNKMFDLISMRTPVAMSRTRAVEDYFDEACFRYFESGDERDLARALRELHADPEAGRRMVERVAEVSRPYGWVRQREIYQSVVDGLLARPAQAPERRSAPVEPG